VPSRAETITVAGGLPQPGCLLRMCVITRPGKQDNGHRDNKRPPVHHWIATWISGSPTILRLPARPRVRRRLSAFGRVSRRHRTSQFGRNWSYPRL